MSTAILENSFNILKLYREVAPDWGNLTELEFLIKHDYQEKYQELSETKAYHGPTHARLYSPGIHIILSLQMLSNTFLG